MKAKKMKIKKRTDSEKVFKAKRGHLSQTGR